MHQCLKYNGVKSTHIVVRNWNPKNEILWYIKSANIWIHISPLQLNKTIFCWQKSLKKVLLDLARSQHNRILRWSKFQNAHQFLDNVWIRFLQIRHNFPLYEMWCFYKLWFYYYNFLWNQSTNTEELNLVNTRQFMYFS